MTDGYHFRKEVKIIPADTRSNSVRITIPSAVTEMLQLEIGDMLQLDFEINDNKAKITLTELENE